MREIIPLGWFHTFMGMLALVSGVITLTKYREIKPDTRSGKIYLVATLITAGTALAIFQRGGLNVAHALAALTLAALGVGTVASFTKLFGGLSRYVRALAYTATLLFHCIPAITDALLRLPVGDPFLTSIEDPIMQGSHLALLVLFLIGVSFQLRWIHRQENTGHSMSSLSQEEQATTIEP
jgi:hypothetical protein